MDSQSPGGSFSLDIEPSESFESDNFASSFQPRGTASFSIKLDVEPSFDSDHEPTTPLKDRTSFLNSSSPVLRRSPRLATPHAFEKGEVSESRDYVRSAHSSLLTFDVEPTFDSDPEHTTPMKRTSFLSNSSSLPRRSPRLSTPHASEASGTGDYFSTPKRSKEREHFTSTPSLTRRRSPRFDVSPVVVSASSSPTADISLDIEPDVDSVLVQDSASRPTEDPPIPTTSYILGTNVNVNCCNERCLMQLTGHEVEQCNLSRLGNNTKQRQFILDSIHTFRDRHDKQKEPKFVIRGKSVCQEGWRRAYGISNYKLNSCLAIFRKGKSFIRHGNSGRRRSMEKTTTTEGWMSFLFERIGDFMPHKDEVHLPPTYSKRTLYDRMVNELILQGVPPSDIVSYGHFNHIWRSKFSKFRITKRSEFSQCTDCTRIMEAYNNCNSPQDREGVKKLERSHAKTVEKERKAYHRNRQRSQQEPDEITTIIIDGMDQSKTNLPHLVVRDKSTAGLAKLRVHLTGVLLHSGHHVGGKQAHIFRDLRQVPHDSNLTINCLLKVLLKDRNILGRVLFLQLDNCYRENKNKFLFSFMAVLVELKIFKEVYVHFLPVGHTHEDIDQLFSRIAVRLNRTNAYFLDDLDKIIEDCYHPKIIVEEIKDIFDVKEWITPFIAGQFVHHSHPHWFWFHSVSGKTLMMYKLWKDDPWRPSESLPSTSNSDSLVPGLICLKGIPDVSTPPAWVKPLFDRMDPEAVMSDIPHKYSRRIPAEAYRKWEAFTDNMHIYDEVPDPPLSWPLYELMQTRLADVEQEPNPIVNEIAASLQRDCPDVFVGQQGRHQGNIIATVENYGTVMVGAMIAVHLHDSSARPYIGKVVSRTADSVNIHWFQGSWLKPWKAWFTGAGKNRVPYQTEVPVTCSILWDFQLTPKGCLKKHTVLKLKSRYAELDEKDENT